MTDDITRQELDARFAAIDMRFAAVEKLIESTAAKLQAEIQRSSTDTLKWVVGTVVSVTSVALAVMTFVVNTAVNKGASEAARSTVPPVMIVNVPAGSTISQPPEPAKKN
ncbi:MAG: hypothetical protein ACXU8N_21650 [Telluria sp.]